MKGRSLFIILKPIIKVVVFILSCSPFFIRNFLYDFFAIIPTKLGVFFSYCLVASMAESVGDNVYIGRFVIIKNIKSLKIGHNVSIHEFCYIDAIGNIEIGDDVSIAHKTSLISFEHTYSDSFIPIKYNPITLNKIVIENDIWIGSGCSILGGSIIKKRVIVAAGAVYKDQGIPNVIYGGIPARIIKDNI